ncbi:hypothetical protein HYW74_04390 [Candidatus Pacearchaeota archaeon]|nr:hypothetical protein [Candidatus Pacearchaeota archaeon]
MEKQELRQQIEGAKQYLEGILATYDKFFVSRADKRRLQEMLVEAETHYENEMRWVNCTNIDIERGRYSPPHELQPYPYEFDAKVVEKIVDHAVQYKKSGKVKYKVNDEYVDLKGLQNKLSIILNGPKMPRKNERLIRSFLKQLNQEYPLSAKQITIVEYWLKKQKEMLDNRS